MEKYSRCDGWKDILRSTNDRVALVTAPLSGLESIQVAVETYNLRNFVVEAVPFEHH
jgi:hypothetical protein